MRKATIRLEIDERDLAHAKAFVAKNGGSLNELVGALFASLGEVESRNLPAIDPSTAVLVKVSSGKLSITEAARQLELPDAGYVFHRLAELKLPLPRLPENFVTEQVDMAHAALMDCLLEPAAEDKK